MPKVLRCLDCGALTSYGSRCPRCQATKDRERDLQRGTSDERGYTRQWHNAVRQAIAAQPYCSYCGTEGSATNPLTGDHVMPVSKGGTAEHGIVVACRRCNSSRGART